MTDAAVATGTPFRAGIEARFARKRLIAFGVPAAILAYFAYIFFAFDVPGLAERASLDNAQTLMADTYSYKTHVTRNHRGAVPYSIAIEGERKGEYPEGMTPDWVSIDGEDAVVELEDGYEVVFEGTTMRMTVPGYGLIQTVPSNRGVELTLPDGPVPDWINASKNRVSITTPAGRVMVTRSKTDVFRYFFGWELFWFTLESPYYDKGIGELFSLAMSDEELEPGTSNFAGMVDDFWNNRMWRHGEVAGALFDTILMAFLGTVGAALIALPLSFLAARNFTPFFTVRFSLRRVFDLLRAIDALIWTLILNRSFGPGPLTGSLAILLTDTGTFGKLFSEALENVDKKQIEGVRSTGAKPVQRYRFGVIPQITPVFLSQILYYLESNSRSATVIGAMVGGGIGLMLVEAIKTGKDWEEVTYIVVLIIFMVIMMDTISGWLRRKLIKGGTG